MRQESIIVKIDSEIKELIPGFLENRHQEKLVLKSAVLSKDFKTLQSIGHKLKGSAGGYGFGKLGEYGAQLEIAAKAKQIEKTESIVLEIEDYLSRVQVEFTKVA